jgi:hypothetical protein
LRREEDAGTDTKYINEGENVTELVLSI